MPESLTASASTNASSAAPTPPLHPGLEGVVLSETRISRVDGERGALTLAGYRLESIAPHATFEELAWLLQTGERPSVDETERLRAALAERRTLPTPTVELLRHAASRGTAPMLALRQAAATFDLADDPAPSDLPFDAAGLTMLARMPIAVAAFERLRRGLDPVAPRTDLGQAASLLHGITGDEPSIERTRALDTYLCTVADHGCNASTFTARVIVSTGGDLASAIVGAIGALSGPLHGGAPGPALDLVREIATPDRAEAILSAKLAAGDRLMGFGHRVYKVRDPRAEVLAGAAERLFGVGDGDRELYTLFRHVEDVAVRLLEAHKPGRRLQANVELYTALLLDTLGFPSDLFSSIFAVARTAGWLAHAHEQQQTGRLIRPKLHYVGGDDGRWVV